MAESTPKQFILPFSDPKKRASQVETAAVYAVADFHRSRGGGLLNRQPEEKIEFISKLGYPVWAVPKGGATLVFDGLGDQNYNVAYFEAAQAQSFMHQLEANMQPRDKYTEFLTNNHSYFAQLPTQKNFSFKGLLANIDFRVDFTSYLKEATEKTDETPTLEPTLTLEAINAVLGEVDAVEAFNQADAAALQTILEQTSKATEGFLAEINFEAAAVNDEFEAKIKAQQEIVNPQIAALVREYKAKTKSLAAQYDRDLDGFEKLRRKTLKDADRKQLQIDKLERETHLHAQRGHEVYARRWRDKVKAAQKEHSDLKRTLKDAEDNIKRYSKEKGQSVAKLNYEAEDKTALLKAPILALQAEQSKRITVFAQEKTRLLELQGSLEQNIKYSRGQRESSVARFNELGVGETQFKTATLVYVPFYLVSYKANSQRRYMCLSPSTVEEVDLSAKFKGALGMSKIKDLFTPRFSTLAAVIGKTEELSRQNSVFEQKIYRLGTQSNLLNNGAFLGGIIGGLSTLKEWGWLSERETAEFSSRFAP